MDKKETEDRFLTSFVEDDGLYALLLFTLLFGTNTSPNSYQIADIDKRLNKLEGKMEMLEKIID